MLATQAAECELTGSFEMSCRQGLSAGNSEHPAIDAPERTAGLAGAWATPGAVGVRVGDATVATGEDLAVPGVAAVDVRP
jgi:hypothetical protein